MKSYIETARPGFWAWLAQIYGSNDTWGAIFMINVIQALEIFLVLVIVVEILIVIYVYPRKNVFSWQILEKINEWAVHQKVLRVRALTRMGLGV